MAGTLIWRHSGKKNLTVLLRRQCVGNGEIINAWSIIISGIRQKTEVKSIPGNGRKPAVTGCQELGSGG